RPFWERRLGFRTRFAIVRLDHGMEVRPAEAECAHPGTPGAIGVWMKPGLGPVAKPERTVPQLEPGVDGLDPDGRRHTLVIERQRRIDEPRQAGCALGVANQRLHGAHDTGVRGRAPRLEDLAEGLHLHSVT